MDREITLRDYGRVLWSGRALIVLLTVVALVIGLLFSFVRTTTYTTTATIFLGQATSANGVPVQTALTTPSTAAAFLAGDQLTAAAAKGAGLGTSQEAMDRVRKDASFSIARSAVSSGNNQPAIATIQVTDRSRDLARAIANAYADAVIAAASVPFNAQQVVQQRQVAALQLRQRQLQSEADRYRAAAAGATGERALLLSTVLGNIQGEMEIVSTDLAQQQLTVLKASQIEQPSLVSRATSISSSGSLGKRLLTALFAAIIGFIIGIIAVLIWKGGPAGRGSAALSGEAS